MSFDSDLTKMMGLCCRLIGSQTGKAITPDELWKDHAQVLAVKIFRHVASAQQISAGIKFNFGEDMKFSHVDHSSVSVIVRAAIESYLAFNYIFINEDPDLSRYRMQLWVRAGLMDRSKMLATTAESKEVVQNEAIMIQALTEEIKASKFYSDSNRETKKKIDSGEWKPLGGWFRVNDDTGIHSRYFTDIYNHLSGHSHASFISAIQIRDADTIEEQNMLASGCRQFLCLIMAHFLFSYIKLFPDAEAIMRADAEAYDIADGWHVQKEDVISIYGP